MDLIFGLGSNLGDRLAMLRRAAERLTARLAPAGSRDEAALPSRPLAFVRRSAVVESAPAGGPPQGAYLNAALWLQSDHSPRELLLLALGIEHELGRVRPEAVRWGPRVIDIDLLWIRDRIVDEPDLQVPHPRLRTRPFALQPLVQIAPDATDPADGVPYAVLAAANPLLPIVGQL